MRVVITRKIPLPAENLLKEAGFEVVVNREDKILSPSELKAFVNGADAVISLLTDKITAEVFDAAGPQLKIVANYAVGFDNIDLNAARERKVYVTNTPGVLTESVAEFTFALILALTKKLLDGDKYVRANQYHGWEPELLVGSQLYGKEIGVVGLGRIGSYVAKIAHSGFSMQVLYFSRHADMELESKLGATYCDNLEDLLTRADIVSLHVPLTPETTHFIGKKELSMMKKSAMLINTARGAVVDEAALIQALREGWIAGAGLDVFETETSVNPELYSLPNTVLTPHIASSTLEARAAMSRIAAENVIDALAGKMPADIAR